MNTTTDRQKAHTHEVKHVPTGDIIMGGTETECQEYINNVVPEGVYKIQPSEKVNTDRQKAMQWWNRLSYDEKSLLMKRYKINSPIRDPQIEALWIKEDTADMSIMEDHLPKEEGEQDIKCTPGEWQVKEGGYSVIEKIRWFSVLHNEEKELCMCSHELGKGLSEEIRANFHLFAASKDMYNALKNILPILESERTQSGISLDVRYQTEWIAAKEALSKAIPK